MCGINGFSWPDETLVRRMNHAIAHRGPDHVGVYVDGYVSLGNQRLAIIDLSESGNQPMSNEKGDIWITFNGEIYNFKNLRDELVKKGHAFRSHTDTETIVHLYEEEGYECVKRLRGMFAFCIYDSRRKVLFLARDRLGIKPLYYFVRDGKFIFSSEIRGICEHALPREVDDGIVYDYLFYGRVDHCQRTFFKGIMRVPPARKLVYHLDDGRLENDSYWSLDLRNESSVGLSEAEKQLLLLLEQVVKTHTVADVPIGTCLSGGLDSSTIVTFMKHLKLQRFSAYSAVFPGLAIDESKYILDIATRLGIDSKTVAPDVAELRRRVEEFVGAQEEPVESVSPFGQFKVMELAASNQAKVLLDGQGGDELFGGYPHYLSSLLVEDLRHGRLLALLRKIRTHGLGPLFIGLAPNSVKRLFLRSDLLGTGMRYQIGLGMGRGFARSHAWESEVRLDIPQSLRAATQRDLMVGLQALLRYEDKNSMHFSIEARVPFLDHELVEFAFGLPSELKYREGRTKYVLRTAMRSELPDSILSRGKLGFPTPEEEWVRDEPMANYIKGVLSSDSFRGRQYFDPERCLELFDKHRRGEIKIGRTIWRWINLELWLRAFIDKSEAEPVVQAIKEVANPNPL